VADPGGLFPDIAARAASLLDSVGEWTRPTVRLGVTGLSRAGKTVFITALINALVNPTRLPVFRAASEGRIRRAWLAPQPDDAVPRFAYEDHLAALSGENRHWPASTTQIAELRVIIEYESASGWMAGPRRLALDIVDYPGEWLLDLALLDKTYAQWASETLQACRSGPREAISRESLAVLERLDPQAPADERQAEHASDLFKSALAAARAEPFSASALPPGRFLMPGDLAGSPALTFAPLALTSEPRPGSLGAMMQRRYDAYRRHVVRPFFRDHFARLDRQIVLVDLLSALNAGPHALDDLETALDGVLGALRTGSNSLWSRLFQPRIDRVLFAATKADHLHTIDHDRLEAILARVVGRAQRRAAGLGAAIDTAALASVRATREADIRTGDTVLRGIVGTPEAGERIDGRVFDGTSEAAIYPGTLPEGSLETVEGGLALRFVKFRPPAIVTGAHCPHIRLDRALEFLVGDRLA
jgi:predicted YcjX-like family ATPase